MPRVRAQFVAAGADVLTTNSFVVTPFALARGRAPWDPPSASEAPRPEELAELLHAAARCANDAAATATGRQVLVAGCLPPLATCYRPEEVGPEQAHQSRTIALLARSTSHTITHASGPAQEMAATYQRLVAELAPRVDLFLAETLSCTTEARSLS